MARVKRLVVPGIALHVVQRGVDRQPCFFDAGDQHFYLAELAGLALESGCAIHAFVLMDNHVHLLLTPATEDGPSRLMHRLGRRYVRRINDAAGRTGTLWEGRFRSCLVGDDAHLLECHRYIDLNPVRAGMVGLPGDWPWSSHRVLARGEPSALLKPHPRYLELASDVAARQEAYRALVAAAPDLARLAAIRDATNGNYAFGSARFQREIEAMLGRRAARRKPGRRAVCKDGEEGE
jgi:putative transposase